MEGNGDPGWRRAVSGALLGLLPGWRVLRRRRRPSAVEGLTALRQVFVSFACAIGLIGAVVAVLEANGEGIGSVPEPPVAVAVLLVGAASLGARRVLLRPLPCGSEAALATGYRQRFFLQIAVAEAAALVGFTGYILSSAGWIYPLGAFFTLIGFARLAPTARHLQQDQDDLRNQGCELSLVSALWQLPGSAR